MRKIVRKFLALVLALFALFVTSYSSKNDAEEVINLEVSGEIVMGHSFTQGPQLESIQMADEFMKKHQS